MRTLAEQLDEYLASLEERADPALMAAWTGYTQRVLASGVAGKALAAGMVAPDFTLPDSTGKPVSLHETLARGPVVLSFVRGGWCPFCTLTLRALAAAYPAITRRGASVLAISPQTARHCLNTIDGSDLPFPLLSDHDNAVARSYRLSLELPEEVREIYRRFGDDIGAINGSTRWELPMPAGFVIAPDGRVLLAKVDPRVEKRLEPTDALKVLDSLALAG